jgi:hypothetical protein
MSVLFPDVSRPVTTCYDVINKEALRLFEPQKIDIEVLHMGSQTSSSENRIHTSRVRTLDQLNTHLQVGS